MIPESKPFVNLLIELDKIISHLEKPLIYIQSQQKVLQGFTPNGI